MAPAIGKFRIDTTVCSQYLVVASGAWPNLLG